MQLFACVSLSSQQGAVCTLYMTIRINLHRKHHFLIYNWLLLCVFH